MTADEENQKTCFVIAPIGNRGTEIRLRSDQVFDHIISPVVSKQGYNVDRADKIPDPGMITHQIIERLLDDDLVVADLTSRNANVFHELAIRHAVRRPAVIMIAEGEDIPFDVSQSRAIEFDYRDLDSVAKCKTELRNQICSLEESPNNVFSPISTAIDLRAMRESVDPFTQRDAHFLSTIQSLQDDFNRLERRVNVFMRGRVGHRNDSDYSIQSRNELRRAQEDLIAARREHDAMVEDALEAQETAIQAWARANQDHEAAIEESKEREKGTETDNKE